MYHSDSFTRPSLRPAIAIMLATSMLNGSVNASAAPLTESASARQVPEPKKTSDAKPISAQLSNGFKYILLPSKSSGDAVSIRLVVNVGSRNETDKFVGISHLVEHVVASTYNAGPVAKFLAERSLSGNAWNASVGINATIYRLDAPSTALGSSPVSAVQLVSDVICCAAINATTVEAEKANVLTELETGRAAEWRKREVTITETLFGSRVRRDSASNFSNLQRFTLKEVRHWFRQWYRPDNITLVVVGDIDTESWEGAIKTTLEPLERPLATLPGRAPLPDPAPSKTIRILPVNSTSDEPYTVEIIGANLHNAHLALIGNDQDVDAILESFARRLLENRESFIKRQTGQTVNLRSLILSQVSDDLPFLDSRGFRASVAASSKLDLLEKVHTVAGYISQIREFGFSDAEIERARRTLQSDILEQPSSVNKVADAYGYAIAAGQDPKLIISDSEQYSRLSSVTAHEIRKFMAKKVQSDQSLAIVVAVPAPKALEPKFLASVQEKFKSGIIDGRRFPLNVNSGSLPTIGKVAEWNTNISLRSTIIGESAHLFHLPAGQHIIVDRSELGKGVLVSAVLPPLDFRQVDSMGISSIEAALSPKLKGLAEGALGDFLSDHGIAVNFSAGKDYSVLQISGRSGSLEAVLKLLRIIARPAFKDQVEVNVAVNTIRVGGQVPGEVAVTDRYIAASVGTVVQIPKVLTDFRPSSLVLVGDVSEYDAAKLAYEYLSDVEMGETPRPKHVAKRRSQAAATELTRWKDDGVKAFGRFSYRRYLDSSSATRVRLNVMAEIYRRAVFARMRNSGLDYYASAALYIDDIGNIDSIRQVNLAPLVSIPLAQRPKADESLLALANQFRLGELNADDFRIAKQAVSTRLVQRERLRATLAQHWIDYGSGNSTSRPSQLDILKSVTFDDMRAFITDFFRAAEVELRD